jgi:hypothetical protein
MMVDGVTGRLDDEDIRATDVFLEFDARFVVPPLGKRVADALCQCRMRTSGENLESPIHRPFPLSLCASEIPRPTAL